MNPKFTISIIALNNIDLTRRCLASVLANSQDFELILTDNGSTDGVGQFFDDLTKKFQNVRVIHNSTNLGYQMPNKMALEMASGRYLILLNNDCEVPSGWLAELEKPFNIHANACISGPQDCASALHDNFHGYRSNTKFEYVEFSTACLKVELFRKHGLWEHGIKFAYADDSSTCLRMRELGYTLHLVPIRVIHHGGRTSRFVPDIRRIQEENHVYCRARFKHYLAKRKFDYPIIVRRKHAWGDALLTTPIVRALKQQRPCSPIWVETNCLDVFKGNPHVARVAPVIPATPDALVIDLNMAYENKKETSIVEAYAQKAGITNYDNKTELFGLPEIPWNIDKSFIAVHVGPSSWRSKNWPIDRWRSLLNELGMKVVLVGHNDRSPLPSALDVRGITNLHQLAAVLAKCSLCISIDSLPLHVAQAIGTPVIGLFGVTDPKFIFTEGSQHIGVCGTTESFGLRHRQIGQIAVDDNCAAINSITVPMVMEAVAKMTKPEKAALAT